jgi:predicted Fe-Mo cluster-binding NifX family protein
MKICIPTTSDAGLAGHVSDHLGQAPYFTLLDSATGETTIRRNPPAHHGQGACRVAPLMARWGVEAVVASQLGRGAFRKLTESGIEVLAAQGRTVADIAEQARRGSLRSARLEEVGCHGHAQGEGHGGCHS